jgi:hypothetical protein
MRINISDKGIDAEISDSSPTDHDDLLIRGGTFFQIKAGTSAKPWQPAWVRRELFGKKANGTSLDDLGAAVRRCFESESRYVFVCFGVDMTSQQVHEARDNFVSSMEQCGFVNPQVEIWGQGQIAPMFNSFPSLVLEMNGIGQAGFQTHASWGMNDDMRRPLFLGPEEEGHVERIRECLLGSDIQHIRLIGEPGVGKTRIAFEATKTDELRPLVAYANSADEFLKTPIFQALLNTDFPGYVIAVVDECGARDRASIWNALKSRHENCKLITLGHPPDDSHGDGMIVESIGGLAHDQIEKIIESYVPSSGDAWRWSRLCSGSPRVAHVIGENLLNNPLQVLGPTPTEDLWTRYICAMDDPQSPKVARRTTVLSVLSLFDKFGFEGEFRNEADYIAKLVVKTDTSIGPSEFDSIATELRRRRILQGGHTLFMVPTALRVFLWIEFWEKYGRRFEPLKLLDEMPEGLRNWFIEAFKYGFESEVVSGIIEEMLGDSGPFNVEAVLKNSFTCRFLDILAEANPESTLNCIERTIGSCSIDKLKVFGNGRYHIVSALEKIAQWERTFSGAAKILALLAEAENSNHSNNATGTFSELFSPLPGRFAPSEASPSQRLPILLDCLRSESENMRSVGLKACETALRVYGGPKAIGAEFQGLKPLPNLWQPETWGEIHAAIGEALEALYSESQDWEGRSRQEANSVIIKASSGLLQVESLQPRVFTILETLFRDEATDQTQCLSFLHGVLSSKNRNYDAGVIDQARSMHDLLVGDALETRLYRYIVCGTWQDSYNEDLSTGENVASIICDLAKEAASEPDQLLSQLDEIARVGSPQVRSFSYQLAVCDKEFQLLDRIIEGLRKIDWGVQPDLLGGYLQHTFENSRDKWDELIAVLCEEDRFIKHLPRLLWASGLSKRGVELLTAALAEERISAEPCEVILYRKDFGELDNSSVMSLMETLLAKGSYTHLKFALLLVESYCCDESHVRQVPEDETLDLLVASLVEEPDTTQGGWESCDYHWGIVARAFCSQYPDRKLELMRNIVTSHAESRHMHLHTRAEPRQVVKEIFADDPDSGWRIITDSVGDLQSAVARNVLDLLSGDRFVFDDDKGLIEQVPRESLWEWIDGDKNARSEYIARAVPTGLENDVRWSFTREFISRYCVCDEITRMLNNEFFTGSGSGSFSQRYREKRDQARMLLADESDANVGAWLTQYAHWMDRNMQREEFNEERDYR